MENRLENKIFLDSGIMITLGKLNEYCMNELGGNKDIKNIPTIVKQNKAKIHQKLQKESINILDKDVDNFCNLYIGIIEKNVSACIPPFVFKEIIMDPTNSSAIATKDFFKHCYLAYPTNEDSAQYVMPVKTLLLEEDLKKVDCPDSSNPNDPHSNYGLAEDIHIKDGKEVDLNIEDRWLISQVEYLSQLDENKKVTYISGNDLMEKYIPGKTTSLGEEYERKIDTMYKNTVEFSSDLDYYKETVRELCGLKNEITRKHTREKVLFLHQNEKDYGRLITNANRNRTYAISNEHSNRDEKAMNTVARQLQEVLTNTHVLAPDSRALENFIANANEFEVSQIRR